MAQEGLPRRRPFYDPERRTKRKEEGSGSSSIGRNRYSIVRKERRKKKEKNKDVTLNIIIYSSMNVKWLYYIKHD